MGPVPGMQGGGMEMRGGVHMGMSPMQRMNHANHDINVCRLRRIFCIFVVHKVNKNRNLEVYRTC